MITTNQLSSHSTSESVVVGSGDSLRNLELHNTPTQVVDQEFSIDELREIAHHFGVPHLAQITERETLVESIRRRI